MGSKVEKKEITLDELDIALLRELKNDCMQGYRDLASKLRMHPNTVMQRIKRLEREHIVRGHYADVDYSRLGLDLHALLLIKVKKGTVGVTEQLKDVAALPQVQSLYAIAGHYDLVMLIQVKDRAELAETLQKIQKNAIIVRTNTFLILHPYKQYHEFNPL